MVPIKITISSPDRIIMIPMAYNPEEDSMDFSEVQIDPIPEKSEDISKNIEFILLSSILKMFNANE